MGGVRLTQQDTISYSSKERRSDDEGGTKVHAFRDDSYATREDEG